MGKGKALWKTGPLMIRYTNSFVVLHRWLIIRERAVYDTQQDLTQTSTSLCNGILTASFTRPIVSSDKTQDVDLDICRFVFWTYDGNVSNFTSPFTPVSRGTLFDVFNIPICLPNNCQSKYT